MENVAQFSHLEHIITAMYVEFARELIRLRDGYLSLSNGFVMPREDIQTVLNCVTTDSVFFV